MKITVLKWNFFHDLSIQSKLFAVHSLKCKIYGNRRDPMLKQTYGEIILIKTNEQKWARPMPISGYSTKYWNNM